MWYVTTEDSKEQVPEYGQDADGGNEEEEDPNRALLFEIPVDSIQVGNFHLDCIW